MARSKKPVVEGLLNPNVPRQLVDRRTKDLLYDLDGMSLTEAIDFFKRLQESFGDNSRLVVECSKGGGDSLILIYKEEETDEELRVRLREEERSHLQVEGDRRKKEARDRKLEEKNRKLYEKLRRIFEGA